MPPTLEGAIHLVSGSAAKGQLIGAGARENIVSSDDKLTSGPCSSDPARHAELRRAWDRDTAPGVSIRRPLDLADLRAAIAADKPIVLWGTRAFSDLVWLWWVLDGLHRLGAEGPRFFMARPASDSFATVGHCSPELALATLAAARPVSPDEWREGIDLWTRYASPSPLAFDEVRRRGSSAFPELALNADLHGGWFPRRVRGRLQLAELDEVLLSSFADTWRTMDDVYETLPELRGYQLGAFDAFFCIERLRAWANHGVLEHQARTEQHPVAQDGFRTTARARDLLAHGLERVADAPPIYVGGCLVNDPASPWVRIETDTGWRIDRSVS